MIMMMVVVVMVGQAKKKKCESESANEGNGGSGTGAVQFGSQGICNIDTCNTYRQYLTTGYGTVCIVYCSKK